ncbi:SAM-dependent methyltransferase, partial [Neobacillus drentensis]
MNRKISEYLKKHYKNSKTDLSAVFIEVLTKLTKENGFYSIINQQSWMFLSRYENLRKNILSSQTIYSMIHLGARAFEDIGGEVVQTPSFTNRNIKIEKFLTTYKRLVNYQNYSLKNKAFFEMENLFFVTQEFFNSFPGNTLSYWVNEKIKDIFNTDTKLEDVAEPRVGLQTGDNGRFLRLWYEVNKEKIGFGYPNNNLAEASRKKWFPYNKGGYYRKWYGNLESVVNWEKDGKEIKEFGHYLNSIKPASSRMGIANNSEFYFQEGLTWSKVTSGNFSSRYIPNGTLFDVGGTSMFNLNEELMPMCGFLNTNVFREFVSSISATLNYEVGVIRKIPYIQVRNLPIYKQIKKITLENIKIAKEDWDSFETSWDFRQHPWISFAKVNNVNNLDEIFNIWSKHLNFCFSLLKSNEENLNYIFIDLYKLKEI